MATSTPWGAAQGSERITRGIVFYSTAGHGGFHVSPTLLKKMPEAWRMPGGWYEEDCDAALVILAFPQFFKPGQVERALVSAKNWLPDELIAAGYSVTLAESGELRERAFNAAHTQDYVVHGALGDWHPSVPAGYVGVRAIVAATGAESYFLVPAEEYKLPREGHPFVIDLARHLRCPAIR